MHVMTTTTPWGAAPSQDCGQTDTALSLYSKVRTLDPLSVWGVESYGRLLLQVGVICQYVIVMELHKRRLFIYIPYAKDQIWTFNLVYIYGIR
jgi:hypothetical protein